MAEQDYEVLIVGAGQGGAAAATALRREKFAGSVGLLGDEFELPYDRPPLSKEYLAGDNAWERLVFRSAEAWAEQRIDLLPGRRIISVDAAARRVTTSSGATITYGKLIWATGGSPRQLSCGGHHLTGVHTVRNRADVDRMRGEMSALQHAVVIGGGYIGLEAASVLRKLGKRVTILEASDRVLARVAGEPISHFYQAEHRSHGVEIRLQAEVTQITEQDGVATGVQLADGSILPAEMIVVGIGIIPAVQPLIDAGAAGGNGVRIDGQCRTSLPNVFAIGDCAEHRNQYANSAWTRIESVQNANDQAAVAAKAIVGEAVVYSTVPWFWSNQYDLRLQTVGLSGGYDEMVVRGDPAVRAFSVIYLRDSVVIALDCVNSVRDYSHGKALVSAGTRVATSILADTKQPLKALI